MPTRKVDSLPSPLSNSSDLGPTPRRWSDDDFEQLSLASSPNSSLAQDSSDDEDKLRLVEVQLGHLLRSGVYSVEYEGGLIEPFLFFGAGNFSIRGKTRFSLDPKTVMINIPFDAFDSITYDAASPSFIFFNLSYTPRFELYTALGRVPWTRISYLDELHHQVAAFASRQIRLQLSSSFVAEEFLQRVLKLPLPQPSARSMPVLKNLNLYRKESLDAYHADIEMLHITAAFQLDAMLYDGLLSPGELGSLRDEIWRINDRRGPLLTEKILAELRRDLEKARFSKEERVYRWAGEVIETAEDVYQLKHLEDQLMKIEDRVRDDSVLKLVEGKEKENHFFCRHLMITPTSRYLYGPLLEEGNSLTRKYKSGVENFLRVSFVEEGRMKLSTGKADNSIAFVRDNILSHQQSGIMLAGRKFQFLGYSQSSLKAHTAWFVAPFSSKSPEQVGHQESLRSPLINAHEIRVGLGTFESIEDKPAMLGARISQSFTSSQASILISRDQIFRLPDIETMQENGMLSNHTDGCGTMSLEVRNAIWESLGHAAVEFPPSVFQIRVGGVKGILELDSKLEGFCIGIRPSMEKFQAFFDKETSYRINIASTFDKPGPLFLNRPLVSALNDLDVDCDILLEYQNAAISEIEKDQQSLEDARELLVRFGLGWSGRLVHLFNMLIRQSRSSHRLLSEEAFLKAVVNLVKAQALRSLKESARIPIPGWHLVGVPDLDSYLKEGEIYACVRENDGRKTYLSGRVAVTRSPTMDPGDVRIVRAVGRLPEGVSPRTQELVNCVVFPVVGLRSFASKMSGGDLDGDQYQIITLPEMVPGASIDPLQHDGYRPHQLDRPCHIGDVCNSFVAYVVQDVVGILAMEHLANSDFFTGHFPTCRFLAGLYSKAVDSAKSGVYVEQKEIPKSDLKAKPDFLRKEGSGGGNFYRSTRHLGILYRNVPAFEIDLGHHQKAGASQSGPFVVELGKIIEKKVALLTPAEITKSRNSDMDPNSCRRLRKNFCSELQAIAGFANFPRRPGQYISEPELFVGTIFATVRQVDQRSKRDATSQMQYLVGKLVDAVERAIFVGKSNGEALTGAISCWKEALAAKTGDEVYGVHSFRWIMLTFVLDALGKVEEEGWDYTAVKTKTSPKAAATDVEAAKSRTPQPQTVTNIRNTPAVPTLPTISSQTLPITPPTSEQLSPRLTSSFAFNPNTRESFPPPHELEANPAVRLSTNLRVQAPQATALVPTIRTFPTPIGTSGIPTTVHRESGPRHLTTSLAYGPDEDLVLPKGKSKIQKQKELHREAQRTANRLRDLGVQHIEAWRRDLLLSSPESNGFSPSTEYSDPGFYNAHPSPSRPLKPMHSPSLNYLTQAQYHVEPNQRLAQGKLGNSFENNTSAYPYLKQLQQPVSHASANHHPLSHYQSPNDPRNTELPRERISSRESRRQETTSTAKRSEPERSNNQLPLGRVRDMPWRGALGSG